MLNIDPGALSDDARSFIDQFASLLAPWGLPTSQGRVYGYVLLQQAPVGLDRIAADLEMSKVGAWNAARGLEGFGHIRRYGERGSKRALYGPSDNYAAVVAKQSVLMGAMGALLQSAAPAAAGPAAGRLDEMGRFYSGLRQAMDAAIHDLTARLGTSGHHTTGRHEG